MTTVTFDVSYGTRAVPLRLPYLSVRRRRAARAAVPAPTADPIAAARARATAAALADRDAALDRALALRAGAGV
ncbi:hypothetical protein [Cellulomonas pakistanensis]|uniref:Uncharacterized protein n=1 Tax=Cellulomonas pakistanensis TaxID=992287 RepID=A0A919PD27_9CELL|nr:hypothetical protein [Cellulomonas pakistanensis]GIG37948.1 hypothetical protein Cpa01nite_33290 [Cellulomonas pakistanensis]